MTDESASLSIVEETSTDKTAPATEKVNGDDKITEPGVEWRTEAADAATSVENSDETPKAVDETPNDASKQEGVEETLDETAKPKEKSPWQPREDVEVAVHGGDETEVVECGEGGDALEADEDPSGKKPRTYRRRVVRIPKDVFEYMARIEEDGTVRLNVTQFTVFMTHELHKRATFTDASNWTTAEVPILDDSVPPVAKEYPTLIVDNFSNDPEFRKAQEIRLRGIIERQNNPKTKASADGTPKTNDAPETKIQPPNGKAQTGKNSSRNRRRKEKRVEASKGGNENNGQKGDENKGKPEQNQKSGGTDDKSMSIMELRKKRLAERDAPSKEESGTAAKVARMDVKTTTTPVKTFPKKGEAQAAKSNGGPKGPGKGAAEKTQQARKAPAKGAGPARPIGARGPAVPFNRPRTPPFSRKWQTGPMPFRDDSLLRGQAYRPQGNMRGEQMRYGEPYPFGDRRPGGDVTSWNRPSTHPEDLQKLESIIRRAAHDNVSSIEAARAVEKLGLSSAMGAMLSTVDRSGNPSVPSGYPFESAAPRSLMDDSYGRFVEPLDGMRGSASRSMDRITYPGVGGGSGMAGSSAPPFGQSYPAFAASHSPYGGGSVDYGARSSSSSAFGWR